MESILPQDQTTNESGKRFIRKRDGTLLVFDPLRIQVALFKALETSAKAERTIKGINLDLFPLGKNLEELAYDLMTKVVEKLVFNDQSGQAWVDLEEVQDLAEDVLMLNGFRAAAKAYILYRERRSDLRRMDALVDATRELFDDYLEDKDWRTQENANTSRSVNGLNNYVREVFTAEYWLTSVYPKSIAQTHKSGAFHIHDLGFFGPYCAGWDLRQLLVDGFGGIPGKVSSKPAKHLRSFLGQIVNATFTAQGECAGAQAWSGLDSYCAPFIRYDGLTYKQVKQALQEFIFNINVPTRVGFQCPFSNVTLDIRVPSGLRDQAVIIGGEMQASAYGEYQAEMDIFNKAFLEVMEEGDASGRVFTFPIPTVNITPDFPWDSPVADALMRVSARYGIPYFANFINSTLSPRRCSIDVLPFATRYFRAT
jgi:ribonucleoside-triphosphate reductase (formate)